jgi:hypothetical protein
LYGASRAVFFSFQKYFRRGKIPMLKELLIKLSLPQEQIDEICNAHEVGLSAALEGYVPQKQYDEVVLERDGLATTLGERDEQLAALQEAADNSEEIETLRADLAAAIEKNENDNKTAAENLAAYKKDNAVNFALANAGAKNPKAVIALLDLSKVSLDGENLIGFVDQLEALKTSDSYLFDTVPNLLGYVSKGSSSGYTPGSEPKDNPFKKETWNLTKQGELLRDNPELYKKLAAAAGVAV